jgi:SAM-dependent methyltransferase
VTTSILAGTVGCRVAALDRNMMMLSRARDRARREGNTPRVMFVCADLEHLPFRGGVFDAVISESVTTFARDRGAAVSGYARVTVPGGRVGINEEIWHEPPTESMLAYVGDVLEMPPGVPDANGWVGLFQDAGLSDIIARPRRFLVLRQFSGELGRYRPVEYLLSLGRFLALIASNRAFRVYLRRTMLRGMPKGLFHRLGYGLFAGTKDAAAIR